MKRYFKRTKGILGVLLQPEKYYQIIKKRLGNQIPYPIGYKQIWWCYFDFLKFRIIYNGSLDDYFNVQMYRKSEFTRKESLSNGIRFMWRDAIQKQEDWKVFLDKTEFYKNFSDELHRKWMIVDDETSWNEYKEFLESCSGEVFVKHPSGYGGKTVVYKCFNTNEEKELFFDERKGKKLVLEEKVEQCEEIFSFTNASVNTFRVTTIIDDKGEVQIAAAALRMGNGESIVDNFSSGGMAALIDVQTGVISSAAKDGNGRSFLFHPHTKKQIIGYKISDWDKYKEFAVALAKKFPGMRYVGWDIIKDSKGNYCVIEGNKDAGIYIIENQLICGLKPYYDALLMSDETYDYNKMHL